MSTQQTSDDQAIESEPPPEWIALWHAAREMLQSFGIHAHEGPCERCIAAWNNLHEALMKVSRPEITQ